MSAFIVDDEAINRVVTYIGKGQKLGEELMAMNCEAVKQRYNEKINQKVIDSYKYVHVTGTKIQILKSLHCLMYQCSEGNVPETQLYKAMDAIVNKLEREVAVGLSEYDRATWG